MIIMMELCDDLIEEKKECRVIKFDANFVEWDTNCSGIYMHKIRQHHMLVHTGCCADMVHVPRGIIHKPHNRELSL